MQPWVRKAWTPDTLALVMNRLSTAKPGRQKALSQRGSMFWSRCIVSICHARAMCQVCVAGQDTPNGLMACGAQGPDQGPDSEGEAAVHRPG